MRANQKEKIRIICLIKLSLWPKIKIRQDLMNTEFHSIWLEVADPSLKINATLIAGFYRVWTHNQENRGTNPKNACIIILTCILNKIIFFNTVNYHKSIRT